MTALLDNAIEVLVDAQFSIDRETGLEHAIAFESPTVLGFLFVYDNPSQLLSLWYGDSCQAKRRIDPLAELKN
ncbi:hypothetical protein HFN49_36805 [Rhizobium leguminosarum]|uniref:hypothetical protein n=1 Tax=Rhizobium ruizarguesonis TaxID=2081791 RepID=UPI001A998154|nr:hypothetical protein [Rhizobium ruizarguesonis]MBY5891679.1 hypothetical protein [Rhizobium leguminosarum]QSZ05104.1 hypothetical protein J3P73_31320 [Rhizobium ruizarguesonis]